MAHVGWVRLINQKWAKIWSQTGDKVCNSLTILIICLLQQWHPQKKSPWTTHKTTKCGTAVSHLSEKIGRVTLSVYLLYHTFLKKIRTIPWSMCKVKREWAVNIWYTLSHINYKKMKYFRIYVSEMFLDLIRH